jgi:spore germination protein (amino acid permease)
MKGKNNITSRQMALFTFVGQTGMGIITLPAVLARDVGHDGWITVLITGLASVLLGILINLLLRRYSDKNIYDINKLLFGKIIGTAFNIVLSVYLMLAAAASARVFSVFLRITLLPRTPSMVLIPFAMLPSIYLVWCGLKSVVRFKYVSCVGYIVSLSYLLLLYKQYRFSFLLPMGEVGITEILVSMKSGALAFLGLEVIAFLFTEVTDKKYLMKWHIIAIASTTLYTLIIVAASTALFGENFLKIQTIPLFNIGRAYHAPILERVDLYLIGLWFVSMGCSMRIYMFAAYNSLQKVYKIKDSKGMVLIFFTTLIFLSKMPKDVNEAFIFRQMISIASVGVCLFFVLCLCLSFIRTKGVRTDESG